MLALSRFRSSLLIASLLLLPIAAKADVTVTNTVSGSTAPTLSVPGTLLVAANLGGDSLTRDGIAFTGLQAPGGVSTWVFPIDSINITITSTSDDLFNTTIGPDELFESEIYTDGQDAFVLNVTGLNPSLTYTFQFLHGETRDLTYDNSMTYTDSASNSDTESLLFGSEGTNYVNQFVEVSGSTSLTAEMPNGGRGPSYSGLIISINNTTAPEPGTLALIGLAIPAFCIVRRNKTV